RVEGFRESKAPALLLWERLQPRASRDCAQELAAEAAPTRAGRAGTSGRGPTRVPCRSDGSRDGLADSASRLPPLLQGPEGTGTRASPGVLDPGGDAVHRREQRAQGVVVLAAVAAPAAQQFDLQQA